MKTATLLAAVLAVALAPASAAQLRYAGVIADAYGRPLEGSYLLRFTLLPDGAAAKDAWSEQRYVKAEGGRFAAVLGTRRAIPDAALRGAYRLSVEAPAGTGWSVSPAPEAPPPVAERPAPPAPAPPPPASAGFVPPPAPADTVRLEAELEQARREREESRRRLEALEKAVTAPAAAPAASAPRIHVVAAGETLRTVAKKTLGDERHWVLIYQANADRIQRAGELTPGQKLLIPGGVR